MAFSQELHRGLPLLPAVHGTSCGKADPRQSGGHDFCCVSSSSVILLWTLTGAWWYRPRLACEPLLSLPDTGVLRLPHYFLTGCGSIKILLGVSPCISQRLPLPSKPSGPVTVSHPTSHTLLLMPSNSPVTWQQEPFPYWSVSRNDPNGSILKAREVQTCHQGSGHLQACSSIPSSP